MVKLANLSEQAFPTDVDEVQMSTHFSVLRTTFVTPFANRIVDDHVGVWGVINKHQIAVGEHRHFVNS